ncbi:MAG TPA: hypothetical protein VEF34_12505 [Syntrophobacteraceae bacterium]|nr:hypothetical protein [Syntrophobacteraceae bacterium]
MWPFRRKQKISSKELARFLATATIQRQRSAFPYAISLYRGSGSKLEDDKLLLEESILEIYMMIHAVLSCFKEERNSKFSILDHYQEYCCQELIENGLISHSSHFKHIMSSRVKEYHEAMQNCDLIQLSRTFCKFLNIPDSHLASVFFPFSVYIFNGYVANCELVKNLIKTFTIDETSTFDLVGGMPPLMKLTEKEKREAAEMGDAEQQCCLGMDYTIGVGVPEDYVQAYLWFDLATRHGNSKGRELRDKVAQRMTPSQIAEAQRLAKEWKPSRKR